MAIRIDRATAAKCGLKPVRNKKKPKTDGPVVVCPKGYTPAEMIARYCEEKRYPMPVFGSAKEELRFHPVRRWRFDMAWVDAKVAVEIDGFAAGGREGRHQRIAGFIADMEKLNEAQILGWRVFRFTTGQVKSGVTFAFLDRVFSQDGLL